MPPDPLGGMQSGYARQYTVDDAFIVYLAGHLVNQMHFSIPDTRQVLEGLTGWLKDCGFLGFHESHPFSSDLNFNNPVEIMILKDNISGKPVFLIRRMIERSMAGGEDAGIFQDQYSLTCIPPDMVPEILEPVLSAKIIFISKMFLEFVRRLELDPDLFPVLTPPSQGPG